MVPANILAMQQGKHLDSDYSSSPGRMSHDTKLSAVVRAPGQSLRPVLCSIQGLLHEALQRQSRSCGLRSSGCRRPASLERLLLCPCLECVIDPVDWVVPW